MQLQEVVEDQAFSPTLIAGALRTTKAEIAGTLGLSQDALSRTTRIPGAEDADPASGDGGDSSPCRGLHRLLWDALVAYAWFRSEALPGFAGLTPDRLVREGKASYVHAHLDRIMAGGYA